MVLYSGGISPITTLGINCFMYGIVEFTFTLYEMTAKFIFPWKFFSYPCFMPYFFNFFYNVVKNSGENKEIIIIQFGSRVVIIMKMRYLPNKVWWNEWKKKNYGYMKITFHKLIWLKEDRSFTRQTKSWK